MKVVDLEQASLDTCVNDAQHERIVITRDGKPIALIIGIEGIDAEFKRISPCHTAILT